MTEQSMTEQSMTGHMSAECVSNERLTILVFDA